MKPKWHNYGSGACGAKGNDYYLGVHRDGCRTFFAVAELFGQQERQGGLATANDAKAEAEKMLLKMVEAMEERIKQIKEQLS